MSEAWLKFQAKYQQGSTCSAYVHLGSLFEDTLQKLIKGWLREDHFVCVCVCSSPAVEGNY